VVFLFIKIMLLIQGFCQSVSMNQYPLGDRITNLTSIYWIVFSQGFIVTLLKEVLFISMVTLMLPYLLACFMNAKQIDMEEQFIYQGTE